MASVSGEEIVEVFDNIRIKSQAGSLASGPTGGFVQIFYNTETDCLSYRNDVLGTVNICASGSTGDTGFTGFTGPTGSVGNVSIFGAIDASGNIESSSGGFTSAQISTGTYEITFDTALSNNLYSVVATIQCSAGADDYLICYRNRTATSFFIDINEQDNGGTPGVPVDSPFSFLVPLGNYEDIVLNTGPTGPTGPPLTGPTGFTGITGPTGSGGTQSVIPVFSTSYFSTTFFTNNSFLSTTATNSIASRIPFVGTDNVTPTRIDMILDTSAGTPSSTMTLVDVTAVTTYGTLVVVVNTTPTLYSMTGITGLPVIPTQLLLRYGPTAAGTVRIYSAVFY